MLSTPAIRGIEEIGPYQILEDLGPAPFGTAYLALDVRSNRVVTLKVLSPSRPGPWQEAESWEILLEETRALSRIYHRGLPVLFEVAAHEGALLLSFAPTEGRSLREVLAQGQRPDRALLLEWGCQLLEILEEAHGEGVLHRHLSEDEVIVASEGHLVVTGFGLTQLVFDPAVASPPEALDGEPCTPRSDLYAVGALLRRLAFTGALRGGTARDPLLKVLARATCRDPAARFGSAGEMADALREAGRAGAGLAARSRREDRPAASPEAPPEPLLRLAAPLPLPARPRPAEGGDLWRALLLLVTALLLMAFVFAAAVSPP
ncbi:MAG TPA: protein kinase [Thermoanaerobaculia bacterium]|nr:protein kinase [Thermoanaerobaculia bacterium]